MGTRGLELGVARVEEEASAKEENESGALYKDPQVLSVSTWVSKLANLQRVVPGGRLGYPRLH